MKREYGPNAASQRARLLRAFLKGDTTDDRAAIRAGLRVIDCCYWKRCGELRALGLIEWVHSVRGLRVRVPSTVGQLRGVSRLTPDGRRLAEAFKANPKHPWPRKG